MQFPLNALTLLLAATTTSCALPTTQPEGNTMVARQFGAGAGNVGLGQPCSSRTDCIGNLSCISGGGWAICSRNLGLGRPCAQNADCNSFNCGAGQNGNAGVVAFECLASGGRVA